MHSTCALVLELEDRIKETTSSPLKLRGNLPSNCRSVFHDTAAYHPFLIFSRSAFLPSLSPTSQKEEVMAGVEETGLCSRIKSPHFYSESLTPWVRDSCSWWNSLLAAKTHQEPVTHLVILLPHYIFTVSVTCLIRLENVSRMWRRKEKPERHSRSAVKPRIMKRNPIKPLYDAVIHL